MITYLAVCKYLPHQDNGIYPENLNIESTPFHLRTRSQCFFFFRWPPQLLMLIFLPVFSSPPCSATMTMPQCAAPTIRTTRTSVSCAGMPASSSLKCLLCQKAPVLLVCTFTLWRLHRYIHKQTHSHAHTEERRYRHTPAVHTEHLQLSVSMQMIQSKCKARMLEM